MSEPLGVGTLLEGRFRLDRVVGEGGFGIVYAGWHLALDAPIAIKCVRLEASAPDISIAFLDEAKVLSRLRHPNIVRVLDVGMLHATESTPLRGWLVMEWCEGTTLADYLEAGVALSRREVWQLLAPVIDAVAAAHEAGIVHRDIKPSNIMLVREGKQLSPRLIDFGIAKRFEADADPATSQKATQGRSSFTPAYAAPEQLTGLRTGPWTDVHALGLLIVEAMTGSLAYGPAVEPAVIVSEERPTPKRHGVDAGAWEQVLEKALALRTSQRHASARELFEALERGLEDGTHSSARHLELVPSSPTISASPSKPQRSPRAARSGFDTTLRATDQPATTTTSAPRGAGPWLAGAVLLAGGVLVWSMAWTGGSPSGGAQPSQGVTAHSEQLAATAAVSYRPTLYPASSQVTSVADKASVSSLAASGSASVAPLRPIWRPPASASAPPPPPAAQEEPTLQ